MFYFWENEKETAHEMSSRKKHRKHYLKILNNAWIAFKILKEMELMQIYNLGYKTRVIMQKNYT